MLISVGIGHTALLSSFCDDSGLMPVIRHSACTIDYSYNFSMYRFSILDHFILSGTLFDECVSSASVLHDVDNLSDHDPIFYVLILFLNFCPYVIVFFLHVFLGSRHLKMMLIIIELLCCVV